MSEARDAQCMGKYRFANQKEARDVSNRVARRHDAPYNPYRCPHCDGWHIGQPNKRRRT